MVCTNEILSIIRISFQIHYSVNLQYLHSYELVLRGSQQVILELVEGWTCVYDMKKEFIVYQN